LRPNAAKRVAIRTSETIPSSMIKLNGSSAAPKVLERMKNRGASLE
jgi:hypothetical protein